MGFFLSLETEVFEGETSSNLPEMVALLFPLTTCDHAAKASGVKESVGKIK